MKRTLPLSEVIIIALLLTVGLLFIGCDTGGGNGNGGGLPVVDTETYTADGVSFVMAYVPGGLTCPTGTTDSDTATSANAYWIGETEVTYELWKKVYDWAVTNGYTFANMGLKGNDGAAGKTNQHPVTTINWRDSMVWCNALTEWYNAQRGTSYECVYTYSSAVIRDSQDSNATDCDSAVASASAKGFRLLSSNEYELAARYRGTDTTNVVTRTIGGVDFSAMTTKWTKGNSVSGDTQASDAATPTVGNYAVYNTNSGSSTAVVKSKTANALELYDMSGNVWEWCFDLYSGSQRVEQGGGWGDSASSLRVGFSFSNYPYYESGYIGFRFARTAD